MCDRYSGGFRPEIRVNVAKEKIHNTLNSAQTCCTKVSITTQHLGLHRRRRLSSDSEHQRISQTHLLWLSIQRINNNSTGLNIELKRDLLSIEGRPPANRKHRHACLSSRITTPHSLVVNNFYLYSAISISEKTRYGKLHIQGGPKMAQFFGTP